MILILDLKLQLSRHLHLELILKRNLPQRTHLRRQDLFIFYLFLYLPEPPIRRNVSSTSPITNPELVSQSNPIPISSGIEVRGPELT